MHDLERSGPRASLTVRAVLDDARASFVSTLGAHVRWNLLFASIVTIAVPTAVGTAISWDPERLIALMPDPARPNLGAWIASYGGLFLVGSALGALHRGVTLALIDLGPSAAPSTMGIALARSARELPTTATAIFLRTVIDWLATTASVVFVLALLAVATRGELGSLGGPVLVAVLSVPYLAWLGWMVAVRAFLGLALPAAHYERMGPLTALARSARLLGRRRWQAVRLRLAWTGIAIVIAAIAGGLAHGIGTLLALSGAGELAWWIGCAIVLGLVALHLVSFGSLLDRAFYLRIRAASEPTPRAIAEVFE
jgi:hypothetical protein